MCMYTCMRACVCVRVYTMLYEYAASLMLTIAGLFKQNTLLLRLTPRSLSRSLSLCVCAPHDKKALMAVQLQTARKHTGWSRLKVCILTFARTLSTTRWY